MVAKHTIYMREWRQREGNAEKHRGYSRAWLEKNRDRNQEWQREYRRKNLEKCRARDKARNPARREKQREYQYRRRYCISVKAYEELVAAAKGLCAICGANPKRLFVDHCHEAGHVRGLLCVKCNMAIGHLDNSAQRALKVYEYLVREALFNQSNQ
jgi:hypothetical protein